MQHLLISVFGVDTEFFKKVVSGGIVSQFLVLIGIYYLRIMRMCPDGYGHLRPAIFIKRILVVSISHF